MYHSLPLQKHAGLLRKLDSLGTNSLMKVIRFTFASFNHHPQIYPRSKNWGEKSYFFLYETFAQMFSLILFFLKVICCQEANNNIKPIQCTPLSVEHCVSDCLFLVSCIKLMTFAASLVITQRYLK